MVFLETESQKEEVISLKVSVDLIAIVKKKSPCLIMISVSEPLKRQVLAFPEEVECLHANHAFSLSYPATEIGLTQTCRGLLKGQEMEKGKLTALPWYGYEEY